MNRRNIIILVIVIAAIVLPLFVAAIVGSVVLISREKPFLGGQVALIRVEGVITGGRGSSSAFGGESGAGAETIVNVLEEFRKDSSVKSAVIRINSPGGSAAGSQEVYKEIMKVRKDGKKITVSMADVAASGGYYIASASDRIYANPATLTGSIGVIMQTADMSKLLDKIGISYGTIKSGPHKDMGSFSRPLTPEEKTLLQGMINDVYDQFLTDVSLGRNIPKPDVRKIADGRIFTGRQALEYKLVDRLGTLQDALRAAADDAGIKGDYTVKEYQRPMSLVDMIFGQSSSSIPDWLKPTSAFGELAQRLLKAESVSDIN